MYSYPSQSTSLDYIVNKLKTEYFQVINNSKNLRIEG